MVKSNKLIALLIFLTLTVVALFTLSSCDTSSISSSHGIEYRLTKDGSSYDVVGTKFWVNENVVIPSTYKGLPVTGILNINSNKIKSVTIPSSVTNIDKHTFVLNESLICINVDDENQYYKSIDGNLYTKDGETLIRYAMGKSDTCFEIPNGVKYINENAFLNCSNLEKVIIPNSVTAMGHQAFLACLNLKSVTIGNGVNSIGYSFSSCYSLTKIFIPSSVTRIHGDAFKDCDSLTIYCETTSKPSGWDSSWNSTNRPVVWGHVHEYENGECVCGMKQE